MDGSGTFFVDVTREGDAVAIAACDTGPGVPTALRERIFEAFYSTKGDGKGTGLGLAQVAGAARQAGGRVELKDSPEGGACFVIYLPRAE
jgi:two-component system, NtrC family, sensor kinase